MITFKTFMEGQMKRSDPWISGDRDGPRPKDTPHEAKMKKYANLSGKNLSVVKELWLKAKEQVDPRLANRWAMVEQKFKSMVGA
jgi:hypothetical protein